MILVQEVTPLCPGMLCPGGFISRCLVKYETYIVSRSLVITDTHRSVLSNFLPYYRIANKVSFLWNYQ